MFGFLKSIDESLNVSENDPIKLLQKKVAKLNLNNREDRNKFLLFVYMERTFKVMANRGHNDMNVDYRIALHNFTARVRGEGTPFYHLRSIISKLLLDEKLNPIVHEDFVIKFDVIKSRIHDCTSSTLMSPEFSWLQYVDGYNQVVDTNYSITEDVKQTLYYKHLDALWCAMENYVTYHKNLNEEWVLTTYINFQNIIDSMKARAYENGYGNPAKTYYDEVGGEDWT